MPRNFTSFPVHNFAELKIKMLNWLQQFGIFCFLDNHHYNFSAPSFECVAAAGALEHAEGPAGNALNTFNRFEQRSQDWMFGHFSYDLKNEIDDLSSDHPDKISFPDLLFFIPRILIFLNENECKIGVVIDNADEIFQSILSAPEKSATPAEIAGIKSRFSKEEYLTAVEKLRQHILRGDCYEINFCQEFYAENVSIDPFEIFQKLSSLSPNPFSVFYKLNDKYLLCASPERFLKKTGDTIISQPIKGTSPRMLNESDDESSKDELFASAKERSENVMVVDLVRNDLSKVCEEDSVKVEELFGIYSFPQVHQLISTVSGKLSPQKKMADIIKATFPMGSMTGAPKKSVMQLIEKYERTRRGLFSGAVGYISPDKDFDFNVVIRSLLYNSTNKYLSMPAGSAITFYSDGEKEYEECLLKAEAMKRVLR